MTDILLGDISKDIEFQHEVINSVSAKSEINAMYGKHKHKQLKEIVTIVVKKDLSFQQRFSSVELHFDEQIIQLESLVENTKKLTTDQLLKELDAKHFKLTIG